MREELTSTTLFIPNVKGSVKVCHITGGVFRRTIYGWAPELRATRIQAAKYWMRTNRPNVSLPPFLRWNRVIKKINRDPDTWGVFYSPVYPATKTMRDSWVDGMLWKGCEHVKNHPNDEQARERLWQSARKFIDMSSKLEYTSSVYHFEGGL